MQKLNQLGLELISMKQELMNDKHSDIVRKALLFQVENMTENKLIEVDTQVELTNEKMLLDEFRLYLMEKPSYMKTAEELRGEYDAIRESITEKMNTEVNLESFSNVQDETITFIQTFELDLEWVKRYFAVKESDIPRLVKENGFVAKFAVLRLLKLVDDFMASNMSENDYVDVKRDNNVYMNVETSSYCLDLIYTVSIDDAEVEDTHEGIAKFISTTATDSDKYVTDKLS